MRLLCVLFVLVSLTGCASSGQKFNVAAIDGLRPGVATIDDATAALGVEPYQAINTADGAKNLQWVYVKSNGITGETEIQSAILQFDKGGRYVKTISVTQPNN